jgi:hypothetical protein
MNFHNLERVSASIYALTVPKIIKLAISFANIQIPYNWVIPFVIMIIYLVMIVKQKQDDSLLIEE